MIYLGDKAIGINNDNRDLQLLGTVTITESLENDTTGNAESVYNNYILPLVSAQLAPSVIMVIASNNTASAYALQKMIFIANIINGSTVLRKTGSNYTTRTIGTTTSAWCSAGTVLHIYRIKEVTPNG